MVSIDTKVLRWCEAVARDGSFIKKSLVLLNQDSIKKIGNGAVGGAFFREFVSLAEVMSAADMTIGGFYKHFESKGALIEEVLPLTFKQSSAIWRQLSERKYDDPGPPIGRDRRLRAQGNFPTRGRSRHLAVLAQPVQGLMLTEAAQFEMADFKDRCRNFGGKSTSHEQCRPTSLQRSSRRLRMLMSRPTAVNSARVGCTERLSPRVKGCTVLPHRV
jgi:AcrR family transcriptional regulator